MWSKDARNSFQSLSGFLARCNSVADPALLRTTPRFNPCRVFLLVATVSSDAVNWTTVLFQSLSGFLARCNLAAHTLWLYYLLEFQSLSGFLARCNQWTGISSAMPIQRVSIPVGFSCSLQLPGWLRGHLCSQDVSIPVGFSCSLQRRTAHGPAEI